MVRRVLLAALLVIMVPIGASAADIVRRWATGVVVATDTGAAPKTIVIKSRNWKGLDMLVGAAVDRDTVIMRGGEVIRLEDVRTGDTVEMEYTRNKTVTAVKIKLR